MAVRLAPWTRGVAVVRPLAVAAIALLASAGTQAALFGDDEARRAILELRQQRAQDRDATDARLTALNTQLDQLKRALLDINAQLDQLRTEMAQQRGLDEVLARDVAEIQRRQKDLQQGIDERVRKLEPQSVTLDGKTFNAEVDEKKTFEDALAKLRQADFAGGLAGLNALLKRYPATGYRESALYWLGNAHYGLRDYKEAIASFRALLSQAPMHQRAPEALLSIANCYTELKDAKATRKALDELIKGYPDSEAAQVARERAVAPTPKKRG